MTRSAYSWLSGVTALLLAFALTSKAERGSHITLEDPSLNRRGNSRSLPMARARYPTRLFWGELPIWTSGPAGVALPTVFTGTE
ncbi:MAG: hypothetical protein CM15mP84_05940 [Cellvibrionales bacterium]|nr:MAG: hypothetical protein CM15mP84_05940 [Cellvibrionales bacterium]